MSRFSLDALTHPIVQAPMAGGPGSAALAAAVSKAGGLGFVAAGYKTVEALGRDVDDLRSLLPEPMPYGVNLFAPPGHGSGARGVAAYADRLRDESQHLDVSLGEPRWDDDRYAAKLDLLCGVAPPVVSTTFGCPRTAEVERLHDAGSAVWVTVTTAAEAREAQAAGADALVVQGAEAGGHRGSFDDAQPGQVGLLALLQLVRAAVGDGLPLVATGGVSTGRAIAAVLAGGAAAAQLGTAFMLCPEAGTTPPHRDAISRGDRPTALTRAFTGRTARGITNRFLQEHMDAPSAYPEIHHLTAPLRSAARARDDAEGFHLWAGEAYALARPMPAADLVRQLAAEAEEALTAALSRLHSRETHPTGAPTEDEDPTVDAEPSLETAPDLLPVLAELRDREPIFHRPELGVGEQDLLRQTATDYWEIGASGRRYSRRHVVATLLDRYVQQHEDAWETSEFQCRQLGPEFYLLTYTLRQPDRLTRRSTIWRRTEDGDWQIVFHQGTPVSG